MFGKIAGVVTVLTLLTMVVSGVFAVEGRYATKIEVSSNTLLILYTQLDSANAERRHLESIGKPVPRSLVDQINRLCRQIRSKGGSC